MKVEFTGRGTEISPQLRQHAETKLNRLGNQFDDLKSASIVISEEKYRHRAEITLVALRKTFHADEETTDVTQSVDRAIEKLEKQARRFKDKKTSNKRNTSETIRVNVLEMNKAEAAEERDNTVQGVRIIKTDNYIIKPMILEEAVEELTKGQDDVLIFHNSESENVNVVYKRNDGNVGFIETSYA